MSQENIIYDLTEVIRGCQRGRKRDVQLLCSYLEKGVLFIPLAETLDTDSGIQISPTQTVNPHRITHPDGPHYGAVFTREDILQTAQEKLGWLTSGKELQHIRTPAKMALALMLQFMREKPNDIIGLLVNPFHETGLQLNSQEIDHLVQEKAIPLVAYAQSEPAAPDESMAITPPPNPLPNGLKEQLDAFIATSDNLSAYQLAQVFNEERDTEPCLAVNLRTEGKVEDPQAIAMALIEKIRKLLPPPGNTRIFFNEKMDF